MGENLPKNHGEQAIDRELADELRNYAGVGFSENGDDITTVMGSKDRKTIDGTNESQIHQDQSADTFNILTGETSQTLISKDTKVQRRKGSIMPPRLPKDEIQSIETSAGMIDEVRSSKAEAGTKKVGRQVNVRDTMGYEGQVAERDTKVEVVKSTTHAPRGMEGQNYFHRGFKDSPNESAKEKEERYSQLLMGLAAKRVRKAKQDEVVGSEMDDNTNKDDWENISL
jgi:hypothetical protein